MHLAVGIASAPGGSGATDPGTGGGLAASRDPGASPGAGAAGRSGVPQAHAHHAGGIAGGTTGAWYRIQSIVEGSRGGSADADYALVLPAVLNAAAHRRSFIAGWLSRGGGAPLELVTNAGLFPVPGATPAGAGRHSGRGQVAAGDRGSGRPDDGTLPGPDSLVVPDPAVVPDDRQGPIELLFPWGARGTEIPGGLLGDLDRLVWAPCALRLAPPLRAQDAHGPDGAGTGHPAAGAIGGRAFYGGPAAGSAYPGQGMSGATLFETALTTLMGRPFGWLVVADPGDSIEAEIVELRTRLTVLRRYEEERARFEAERAQRRLAELDAYREAGLWNVRVLAGAADLSSHPYRLRIAGGAMELADALAARISDPADGAQVPHAVTAGTLAALTGLPRL